MKHKLFTLSIIFLLFAGLISINAQPKKATKDGPKRLIEQLQLTDAQQAKFDQYQYENQKQLIELKAEIQKNRLEIKHLMDSEKLDETKIMDLVKANGNLENTIKESRVKMMLNIYNILDDSQKDIWKDHIKHFGDRGPGMMTGKKPMMGNRFPGIDRMRSPMQRAPEPDTN